MPEFILNAPSKSHPYHALSEFAQGYVEAMFFTNGDTGDDREDLLNEMGVERLTKKAIAAIEVDCDRFYEANKADIELAQALKPGSEEFRYARDTLDDTRCGHLFWYARQGHGVGWSDDGDASCLDRLQDASRAFGEAHVETWRGWIHYR